MQDEFNKKEIEYLAIKIFNQVYGECFYNDKTDKAIDGSLNKKAKNFKHEELLILDNRASRILDTYSDSILDELDEEYCDDIEYKRDYFKRPQVTYNDDFYELWKSAVAKKEIVKIKYESISSGMSERLVNPYRSKAPYVEGYCHKRKEVLKFRMDRMISIKLTGSKFVKKNV